LRIQLMARTLQKLAHRRQSEELERQGHDGNGDDDDRRAGSGRDGQGAIQTIPVSLVLSENGKTPKDSNTPGGSDETLNAILIQPSISPSTKDQKLYKNQANSIIEEDEDESESEQNGNGNANGDASAEDGQSKLVKEGAYLKSRLWWFGLLLIATGEGGEFRLLQVKVPKLMRLGNFLSYGFAPASVVAPLGTVVSHQCWPTKLC
jgi:hypothetical protein